MTIRRKSNSINKRIVTPISGIPEINIYINKKTMSIPNNKSIKPRKTTSTRKIIKVIQPKKKTSSNKKTLASILGVSSLLLSAYLGKKVYNKYKNYNFNIINNELKNNEKDNISNMKKNTVIDNKEQNNNISKKDTIVLPPKQDEIITENIFEEEMKLIKKIAMKSKKLREYYNANNIEFTGGCSDYENLVGIVEEICKFRFKSNKTGDYWKEKCVPNMFLNDLKISLKEFENAASKMNCKV